MNIVIIVPESARTYAKELTGTSETIVNEQGVEETIVTPSGLFEVELLDENENKFYISSGEFLESELNALLNSDCEHFVYFGEASEAIALKGLSFPPEPVIQEEPVTEEPVIPVTEEPV